MTFGAVAAVATLTLAACGSSDTIDADPSADNTAGTGGGSEELVIGSQDYYSSEIIAEIYAQALEAEDYSVQREYRIGQREIYVGEIEDGSIDLFPEYTGPLLQFWEPDTEARLMDDVYDALVTAAPQGVSILDQSPATDQDSYVVTQEFADEYDLTTIADLANVTQDITLGANSELESRPNGPDGLKEYYGVDVGFTPIEDGGGPLTVKALQDGDIQLAVIYTADPSIDTNNLVTLEDPEGLFLASHVVPVASERVDADAQAIINSISAAMTPEILRELNARSVTDQSPAATIAADWLADTGMVS
ncbi:ABC transporter substrate-binding protein [Jonesia quinghaiensis]|uniref:ABC transporter substrate-binding protein n=1 Tax=Jonesia quinghaiensis TaxID=262806 RepID=UPI0012FC1B87